MFRFLLPPAALILALPLALSADSRSLITRPIDESRMHTLRGNTRPEANAANDRGVVSRDLAMDHMLLQMQPPPEQVTAAAAYVDSLQDPSSPNFHKWLTPEEFGSMFGPSQQDVDTVSSWLQSHGFTIDAVYPSKMTIAFSGTAGQVQSAFKTEIHRLSVNGAEHIANMSDPQIPEALAPAVAGIVSLNDFKPHAMRRAAHAMYTYGTGQNATQAVVPADLATIYDMNKVFTSLKVTGAGQTIAVLEDSDLYSTSDWNTFRSTFGLSSYGGTLTTVHPGAGCHDPGVSSGSEGDDIEAELDAEWASAAAPGAAIEVASCADTYSTFGGLIALNNLVNASSRPEIVSVSYGNCEAENGASSNAQFNSVYEQAASEGISVFVAAGDEGAASCDSGATTATHGIGVSSWASTPYNVAAGGTDFEDSYLNTTSTYWSNTNSSTYGSAKSYIPEIPWNDSCASTLLASALGFTDTYGAGGLCQSSTAQQDDLIGVVAGSGGPSGCATGAPSEEGVVGGTCQGYAKPSWQKVKGNPADGVRDIPDVSMFSADGVWGHYYVFCFTDERNGGSPCTGAPSNWAGAGGTSFSSPILAGIQALINQHLGTKQGNPNPAYYSLASNTSVFHATAAGDNDVNCQGTVNCYDSSEATGQGGHGHHGGGYGPGNFGGFGGGNGGTQGVLSTSSSAYDPAYKINSGWNFATGLGSVDVYNLLMAWPK